MNVTVANVSAAAIVLPYPFPTESLAASASKTFPLQFDRLFPSSPEQREELAVLDRMLRSKQLTITPLESNPQSLHSLIESLLFNFCQQAGGIFQPKTAELGFSTTDCVFGKQAVLLAPTFTPAVGVTITKLSLFSAGAHSTDGTNYGTLTVKKTNVDGTDAGTICTITTNSSGGAALTAGTQFPSFTATTLTAGQTITVEGTKGGTGIAFKGTLSVEYVLNPAAWTIGV